MCHVQYAPIHHAGRIEKSRQKNEIDGNEVSDAKRKDRAALNEPEGRFVLFPTTL
jgi:hypothetical protein